MIKKLSLTELLLKSKPFIKELIKPIQLQNKLLPAIPISYALLEMETRIWPKYLNLMEPRSEKEIDLLTQIDQKLTLQKKFNDEEKVLIKKAAQQVNTLEESHELMTAYRSTLLCFAPVLLGASLIGAKERIDFGEQVLKESIETVDIIRKKISH